MWQVLLAAVTALDKLVTKITPEVLMEHLEFVCGLLRSIVSDAKHRKGSVQAGFLLHGACGRVGGRAVCRVAR